MECFSSNIRFCRRSTVLRRESPAPIWVMTTATLARANTLTDKKLRHRIGAQCFAHSHATTRFLLSRIDPLSVFAVIPRLNQDGTVPKLYELVGPSNSLAVSSTELASCSYCIYGSFRFVTGIALSLHVNTPV